MLILSNSSTSRYLHARGSTVPILTTLLLAIMLQHCALLLAAVVPAEKRTGVGGDGREGGGGGREGGGGSSSVVGPGQPEEIFTLNNRLESNYDEYPMVVPKRAALLLDRLMVALHHALEKERRKIGDFYDDTKPISSKHLFNQQRLKDKNNNNNNDEDDDGAGGGGGGGSLMYSDDDPSVMLDYDFKDLNSINRATGQTLANNFQRRGHGASLLERGGGGIDLGNGVALLRTPLGGVDAAAGAASIAAAVTTLNADADDMATDGGGGGGGGSRNNIGRMYWRCYFNAVSCF